METIAAVARSASRDETRPVLTGILMSASGQELRMVATDSYRLSVKETALESPLRGKPRGERPRPGARRSWCASPQQAPSESLAVSVGQNQVVFELGDVVLSSRLIDGQFPNYRQLLPESVEHELRLSSAELTDVVRRISLLAQKNAPLRLSFSEGDADRLGADPRRRRGAARRYRSPSTASRSRSASTRSSCATGSRASSPRSSS